MIRQRKEQSTDKVLRHFVFIHAKYAGNCSCGKRISKGDLMCYDNALKQSMCAKCGRSPSRRERVKHNIEESYSQGQTIIDRINSLKALPFPLSEEAQTEINDLSEKLKQQARLDASLRSILIKMRTEGEILAITARYAGKCFHCHSEQLPGEPVAYDTNRHKIICFQCVTGG